jgi:hypothetical protein
MTVVGHVHEFVCVAQQLDSLTQVMPRDEQGREGGRYVSLGCSRFKRSRPKVTTRVAEGAGAGGREWGDMNAGRRA